MPKPNRSAVYPLIWCSDVAVIAEWAVKTLGVTEVWRNTKQDGAVDHLELSWGGGRVSLNEVREEFRAMGPSGIALSLDDRAQVEACHARAAAAGAEIVQGPEESPIAYSFTAVDPDGNQWWVHAETGMLDALRRSGGN